MEFWLAVILRAPRALSQALYETLEGSERLLDDVKEVLNLNRVYAAGLLPEAISPAKLFPKLAAACHCHALFQVVVPRRLRALPRRRLRPPPVPLRRFTRVALDAILEPRRSAAETPLLYGAEALEVIGACVWW